MAEWYKVEFDTPHCQLIDCGGILYRSYGYFSQAGEIVRPIFRPDDGYVISSISIKSILNPDKILPTFGTFAEIDARHRTQLTFTTPKDDFKIITTVKKDNQGGKQMAPESKQVIIDTVEIPEALAQELSELLAKQSIRQQVLKEVIDQPDKYDAAEKILIPVVQKIDAIKVKITREYIPEQYQSDRFIWNYNGYEVNGNHIEIIQQ